MENQLLMREKKVQELLIIQSVSSNSVVYLLAKQT